MARLLVLLLVLVAGCGEALSDPCAPIDGTYVAPRAIGPASSQPTEVR